MVHTQIGVRLWFFLQLGNMPTWRCDGVNDCFLLHFPGFSPMLALSCVDMLELLRSLFFAVCLIGLPRIMLFAHDSFVSDLLKQLVHMFLSAVVSFSSCEMGC